MHILLVRYSSSYAAARAHPHSASIPSYAHVPFITQMFSANKIDLQKFKDAEAIIVKKISDKMWRCKTYIFFHIHNFSKITKRIHYGNVFLYSALPVGSGPLPEVTVDMHLHQEFVGNPETDLRVGTVVTFKYTGVYGGSTGRQVRICLYLLFGIIRACCVLHGMCKY